MSAVNKINSPEWRRSRSTVSTAAVARRASSRAATVLACCFTYSRKSQMFGRGARVKGCEKDSHEMRERESNVTAVESKMIIARRIRAKGTTAL